MSLSVDILEIFVEAGRRTESRDEYSQLRRSVVDTAWANGKTATKRYEIRRERAAARPPCPHCGKPVERVGASAKLPKYCTKKCMRAVVWAKWSAKNGAARNDARRKTARRHRPSQHKSVESGGSNER